jgi:hypothetical protein
MAENNIDGASPEGQDPQQPKMVPESDLMAVKRRAEKAEAEAARIRKENADLLARVEEARLSLPEDAPDTTKALQKTLIEEMKRIRQKEMELEERERSQKAALLEVKKASFAKEYGVPEDVMASAETAEEAELLALRAAAQKKKEPEEETPKVPSKGNYDTGASGGSPKKNLTAADWIKMSIQAGEI